MGGDKGSFQSVNSQKVKPQNINFENVNLPKCQLLKCQLLKFYVLRYFMICQTTQQTGSFEAHFYILCGTWDGVILRAGGDGQS